ncbi:MAG: hypothetical protein U5L07_14930 [Desulfobacterales bacterium]|nr:hypothetical protein [Desulfobacterales bacterium]
MHLINRIFDLISMNQTYGQRYATIALLSLISAAVFLVIFKKMSDQTAIKKEKGKILGHLFQIRLYKDQLLMILSSMGGIFKHNLLYIRYTLPPLVIIIIPLLIITIQINQRCGYAPLQKGNEFIISARINQPKALDSIQCRPTAGIELMTPVLRIPDKNTAYWRAKLIPSAESNEAVAFYTLKNKLGQKSIASTPPPRRFLPKSVQSNGLNAFLYPAEGFLPDNTALKEITVDYKRASYSFLWISMDAIVLYFILTLLFALIIKPLFRVVI